LSAARNGCESYRVGSPRLWLADWLLSPFLSLSASEGARPRSLFAVSCA
jgi:hypothetical protein